jgi:hypothetical protein
MKCLILFLVIHATISFGQSVFEKDFDKLAWLEGSWSRANAKPGQTGFETWIKAREKELIGIGVSLKGTDTSFVEKLKIAVKDNAIYYVADVAENIDPVYFRMIELSSDGFICENSNHDFPKKISYRREGNSLKAITSGDGKSIEFFFVRK